VHISADSRHLALQGKIAGVAVAILKHHHSQFIPLFSSRANPWNSNPSHKEIRYLWGYAPKPLHFSLCGKMELNISHNE